MRMSNVEALSFALIPGKVEKSALDLGGRSWDGVAQGVIIVRNSLYAGLSISLIGMLGVAMSSKESSLRSLFLVVSSIGLVGTVLKGIDLYDEVVRIQGIVNRVIC